MLLFLMLFFSNSEPISHFLVKQIEFGRIFLTRLFSYSILKGHLCTSRRTQLQQKIEMSVSFIILSSFCLFVRCQQFCSHDATFPVHLG